MRYTNVIRCFRSSLIMNTFSCTVFHEINLLLSFSAAQDVLAIVSVPDLLKEDVSKFILTEEDDEQMTPYIVTGQDNVNYFYMMADNIKICRTQILTKAIKLVLCTFFVFIVAYPNVIKGTLAFHQKVFLNLPDCASKIQK